MINFGNVPAGSVLPIPFDSFAGSTGASVTISGLAVTDIEVYKGTSMTQRASDAGYALMDTDGIDLDGTTGIQGFSIDTGDNTDAGFFTAGSFFWVVVSAITVDSQTVNFIAATFRLVAAENTAGTPVSDAVRISGDSTAADNCELFFDGTGYAPAVPNGAPIFGVVGSGTLSGTHSTTTADLGANAPSHDIVGMILKIAGFPSRVVDAYNTGTGVATFSPALAGTPTDTTAWTLYGAPPASTTTPIPANVTAMAANTLTASALATDAVTEIVAAVFARAFSAAYGALTFDELVKLIAAVLLGKASGLETTTATFRNLADNADAVVATVDADGNRTSVTRTP
jgi:hypothetical protein